MELRIALLQIREQYPHEDKKLLEIHLPDRRRGGCIRVEVGQGYYPAAVGVGGTRRIGIVGSVGSWLLLLLRGRGDVPQQLGVHLPQVRGGGGWPCLCLRMCLLLYLLLLLLRRGGRRGQSLELGLLVRVLGLGDGGGGGGGELHHGGDAVHACTLGLLIRLLLPSHVVVVVVVVPQAQVGHGLGRGRTTRRVRRRVGTDRHGDGGGAAGTACIPAGRIVDAAPQVAHEGHGGDGAAVRVAPASGQLPRQLGDEGAVLLQLRQLLLVVVVVGVGIRIGIGIPLEGLRLLLEQRKRGGRIRRGVVSSMDSSLRERSRRRRSRERERGVVLLGMRLRLLLREQEGQ